MNRIHVILVILFVHFHLQVNCVQLVAFVSQHGLHGEIHFTQQNDNSFEIRSKVETTLQYPDQIWSWGIHEMPTDYRDVQPNRRCHPNTLGRKLIGFDDHLGYLQLPGNETTTWQISAEISDKISIWSKSLVLQNLDTGSYICATIATIEENIDHLAEARFHGPIAGSIYFHWLTAKDTTHRENMITSNLFHMDNITERTPITTHSWKIFVTDIFETNAEKSQNNCNVLQIIYDPQNEGVGKSLGDIDGRVGKIQVATDVYGHEAKQLFQDKELILLPSDLTGTHRQLFVVIYDHNYPTRFLACAKIRNLKTRIVKSIFNSNGVKGEVTIHQRSPYEPTWLNFTVSSAKNELRENTEYLRDLAGFQIKTLPPDPTLANMNTYCNSAGGIYNPTEVDNSKKPPAGYGTQDQYPVGDLSGKLQMRNKDYPHNYLLPITPGNELNGIYWDLFLPIQGMYSVVHRGLAIERYNRTDAANTTTANWACGTLTLYQENRQYQMPMTTAQVLFRYPIVGKILFRQPRDDPLHDTTIIIEYLIHADGASTNTSQSHRWAIHSNPPGKDFYDWQNRCASTNQVHNPYKVAFDPDNPSRTCSNEHPASCRLGDLNHRIGSLTIAGSKKDRTLTRSVFTDAGLPLSGYYSIFGKSLVIYDDFGPKARGERLACSIIERHFPRKVVASDWYGNGITISVKGKIELYQQSEYEITNIDVLLKGLNETSGYHIHEASIQENLLFPCEASTIYDHWNPRGVNPKTSPMPREGSTDLYEMGDLSGKFGTLDHLSEYMASFNDTNIPLFGYETVLGRSVVIHKKSKNVRWACSTLERGYSPHESREIRAIASFHHPKGYAYGYMRFTQLIHNDGSKSDTTIEVKLRHPGENDRNMTRHHHWKIFVNPVGVDAVVQQTITRCVAGGYTWNPYYTQLADPLNTQLYEEECGADNPLRCYVGDISLRTSTIDIGDKRVIFSDQNLPLEGVQSALGRSIVLFGPNYSYERFACANIEPDHDIIKYVNLQRPPKFVVAQFMEEVRQVMGVPEWFLSVDSRKITLLHGGACVQMLIHFKGPLAHQMELDLSRLIAGGKLDSPTLNIHGYASTKRKKVLAYRVCGVRDPNEKSGRKSRFGGHFTSGSIAIESISSKLFLFQVTILVVARFL
ncbi:uncharacterized protein LOC129575370 isoform X3 [Sitodiplosis mosellana]|uniref:uncharacterized protein LOC129575370 isoform X3 n=1 Tax=Sitodiplosis mosellana TaxID=263140 RepID=UPI00244380D0|nr:uncharacterized protein LOC129575370 isoform X3 [Sitodiplosis mosellana]